MFFVGLADFFTKNWIRMLVAFLVGLTLMALYNVSQAAGGNPSWTGLEYYRDGSFIAGMILLFIGLLVVIAHFGTFDIFSFYAGRKKKENGHKENFGDYVERKNKERGKLTLSFLSYIIVSLVFISFSLILFFTLQH